MNYPTARLADYNADGSRERLVMESTYDSAVDGRKRFYVDRVNHEVGVGITFEEYSPGSAGKRGYTRQIHIEISREALGMLIKHLQRGMLAPRS